MIKPDATRRNLTGKINAKFEENGLRIVAQKRIRLTCPIREPLLQFVISHILKALKLSSSKLHG